MVTLLKKLFFKQDDLSSSYSRKKYGMVCSILGIFLNVAMFTAKFLVGSFSGSVAIVADSQNNLGDAMTNIGLLVGLYFASIEGGDTHPGGHGRMEWLVGLITSWLVFSLGLRQFSDAILAIRKPEPTAFSLVMVAVLIGSILVKLYMWHYNKTVGAQIDSLSMAAVAADCLTDSLSTSAVLLSVLLGHFLHLQIDGWCGLLVAVFIMYSGLTSLRDAIITILGKGADQETRSHITQLVEKDSRVKGMHGLLIHDYGMGRKFASFYIEGDEHSDLAVLHNAADQISQQVYQDLSCECIVGVDILATDRTLLETTRGQLLTFIHTSCPEIDLWDFRMILCPDHTNVLTVLNIRPEKGAQAEKLKPLLEKQIRMMDSQYVPIVKIVSIYPRERHLSRLKTQFLALFHHP